MPPVGSKPTIPGSERQPLNSLDRDATGIGVETVNNGYIKSDV